ncbi:uncharacterized protein BDZ99DRAFT_497566 [Mytilinidion resinicola]|uniref:DUF7053 domain-containing protein n=1 Tax=Mytilinidion resinicola TaxID=574789 RepID=A0A6A6YTV5_9PEZI|nr:uncharacterized protein BDZ99DRAFT_497566 [Mytilinidion resinicola]KAF2811959.1 hypothetical protein BDZ99DRAFT_497566 [Mytilinidion resinicola]
MSKTTTFSTITPLPSIITREAVISTYHDHIAMIELNPLVVERFKCKPPAYATAEEFHATWYTIKDKIQYIPGTSLANGSVSYHACFHDLPDALQTHVYAPLGLDIKAKWSVGGSLPGEPPQPAELGLGIPKEGLYLREDVKMKCNIMMISFVKKTFKEAHSKLVDRLVEKTHQLEAKAKAERAKNPPPPPPNPHTSIAPGHKEIALMSPMFQPGTAGYQHMAGYPNSNTSSPMTSPQPQHAQTFGVPGLPPFNPYGQSGAYQPQAQNPYASDPRYSQHGQQPQYDQKPLPDPRFSQYPDQKMDPRYSQHGDQRVSMHPADQAGDQKYRYETGQPHPTQFAPVELPTSLDGRGGQTEPVELA